MIMQILINIIYYHSKVWGDYNNTNLDFLILLGYIKLIKSFRKDNIYIKMLF